MVDIPKSNTALVFSEIARASYGIFTFFFWGALGWKGRKNALIKMYLSRTRDLKSYFFIANENFLCYYIPPLHGACVYCRFSWQILVLFTFKRGKTVGNFVCSRERWAFPGKILKSGHVRIAARVYYKKYSQAAPRLVIFDENLMKIGKESSPVLMGVETGEIRIQNWLYYPTCKIWTKIVTYWDRALNGALQSPSIDKRPRGFDYTPVLPDDNGRNPFFQKLKICINLYAHKSV